ncbi:MAG: hypothetical protein GY869_20765 [Planctomycetes bacterium]|nr:hypothetical protein [Planctomycetota bacterium]
MFDDVVITGIGLVTPLGYDPAVIVHQIEQGKVIAEEPAFDTSNFDCPYYARVADFDSEKYFPENKTLRLMNRDSQMAVVAAHLALKDASITVGQTYQPQQIALYGATGVAGLALEEVTRLIKYSTGEDGALDLERFGDVTLKRVRPVLSFKLLANMPICFVSIFENIQGENAVYTPWEGHGVQAIVAGIRAIRRGRTPCALVGGCDVKTHMFSFINMQQLGLFDSWRRHGQGSVPAEGAGFLILEGEREAVNRGAKIYARFCDYKIESLNKQANIYDIYSSIYSSLEKKDVDFVTAASDGEAEIVEAENKLFTQYGMESATFQHPKRYLGNLYAAAAVVQVGLTAESMHRHNYQLGLTNCFGAGCEQGSFVLEKV